MTEKNEDFYFWCNSPKSILEIWSFKSDMKYHNIRFVSAQTFVEYFVLFIIISTQKLTNVEKVAYKRL